MRDLSKTGCRFQAFGLLALLLWATALPVQAAGIPVFDSAAVTQAMKALEQATEQARQMNAMLEQVKLITQAFGQPGVQGTAFQDAFLSMADSQSAQLVKDQLAALKKVAGSLGKDGAGSSNPDFSTFASSQNWVNSQLAVLSNADQTSKTQVRRSRNLMAGQATADAYALALNARSQLAGMDDRAQSLV
ncbi:MAG TPA: hypothetical protein HPP80_08435, partial [Rhodospirillaceae bacterium]|nr:hypothetical protein [Rhodospirillaceae bacterium]